MLAASKASSGQTGPLISKHIFSFQPQLVPGTCWVVYTVPEFCMIFVIFENDIVVSCQYIEAK